MTQEEESHKLPRWKTLWGWTGFGERKLWDWLQLLIVPLVLSLITLAFAWQQNVRQNQIEDRRAQAERILEEQRAQDTALQAYLDQMSQLILEKGLRNSEQDSNVRTLARARTTTVLGRLDPNRKRSVVEFLYESSLIQKDHPIVSLRDANLKNANLQDIKLNTDLRDEPVSLEGANLEGADLQRADLGFADLKGADLKGADLDLAFLNGADLGFADLERADLIGIRLTDADLYGARLIEANLRNAYLSSANLELAELTNANLSGADLYSTDLHGTNLYGTLGVTKEQLEEQAETLEGATMPGGSTHD
jgi:uncharacterized protein YjbI with pentapeptide repeats